MPPTRSRTSVPASQPPLVVKVGGSLQHGIPALVPVLLASPRPLLIIPGGGQYAEAVRQAGLDDDAAHWKAIDAMDTFGRIIASNGVPVTTDLAVPRKTSILLPSACLHRYDALPHTWDVTSDTIAAWVASELRLNLLLIKSVDGIMVGDALQEHIRVPVKTDTVDPCFLPFVLEHGIAADIISGLFPERVGQYLKGGLVPGTRISTTF